MITKQDFLKYGFNMKHEPFKTAISVTLDKDEIPHELEELFAERMKKDDYCDKDFVINNRIYTVESWTESYSDNGTVYSPYRVRTTKDGERICWENGLVYFITDWVDEELRSVYINNCNTEFYYHEDCPMKLSIADLLNRLKNYYQKERKECIKDYNKKLKELRSDHKEEMDENNKTLKDINRVLGVK